jgi:hypothetical protein
VFQIEVVVVGGIVAVGVAAVAVAAELSWFQSWVLPVSCYRIIQHLVVIVSDVLYLD